MDKFSVGFCISFVLSNSEKTILCGNKCYLLVSFEIWLLQAHFVGYLFTLLDDVSMFCLPA